MATFGLTAIKTTDPFLNQLNKYQQVERRNMCNTVSYAVSSENTTDGETEEKHKS